MKYYTSINVFYVKMREYLLHLELIGCSGTVVSDNQSTYKRVSEILG